MIIPLESRTDRDGEVYYIGKVKFGGTLSFKDGAAFLVYLDDDLQQLHYTFSSDPGLYDAFKYYQVAKRKIVKPKNNNILVDLEPRTEENTKNSKQRTFFVGRIKADVILDASNGISFLIFVSDQGEEELQISVQDRKK